MTFTDTEDFRLEFSGTYCTCGTPDPLDHTDDCLINEVDAILATEAVAPRSDLWIFYDVSAVGHSRAVEPGHYDVVIDDVTMLFDDVVEIVLREA